MRIRMLFGLALLTACAGGTKPQIQPTTLDTDQIMLRARAAFHHGAFDAALLDYRRLQFELSPGQPEMAEARYYVAECMFQTNDFAGAVVTFTKVAEEFPTSDYAPLALLRAGDANLRMWPRPEVDPTPGQTALATYQELLGRYPSSDAAARAQLRVSKLSEWFAERSYKIGMFYVRRKAYDSAIIYFKDIVASYNTTKWVPSALLRLVDSYRAIGYVEEMKETCANLRQYYPDTYGLKRRCPAEASTADP
ncbi:MAG TPA: outer membrane protein assembly factor BamD [Gemmatimonadales bacterium]|nr:outer membrane protein assembly factor BamD [Gemmatimonadales bacterium]